MNNTKLFWKRFGAIVAIIASVVTILGFLVNFVLKNNTVHQSGDVNINQSKVNGDIMINKGPKVEHFSEIDKNNLNNELAKFAKKPVQILIYPNDASILFASEVRQYLVSIGWTVIELQGQIAGNPSLGIFVSDSDNLIFINIFKQSK